MLLWPQSCITGIIFQYSPLVSLQKSLLLNFMFNYWLFCLFARPGDLNLDMFDLFQRWTPPRCHRVDANGLCRYSLVVLNNLCYFIKLQLLHEREAPSQVLLPCRYVADPAYQSVPIDGLLSKQYAVCCQKINFKANELFFLKFKNTLIII